MAIGPIVGQLYGAKRLEEAGHQLHQSVWLALGLSVIGCLLLVFPAPFLRWRARRPRWPTRSAATCSRWRSRCRASLLFTAYRGFNTAVSRPKAVMVLQLGGLALKVPLSIALVFGTPSLGIPALGVTGLRHLHR